MSRAQDLESRLIEIFSKLPQAEQEELLGVAELLGANASSAVPVPSAPSPRPETVIGALRRLRRSYPELDRARLMADACDIVAEHALNGCAAGESIARLERLFIRHEATRRAAGSRKP